MATLADSLDCQKGTETLGSTNQYRYLGQTDTRQPLVDLAGQVGNTLAQSQAQQNLIFGGPKYSGGRPGDVPPVSYGMARDGSTGSPTVSNSAPDGGGSPSAAVSAPVAPGAALAAAGGPGQLGPRYGRGGYTPRWNRPGMSDPTTSQVPAIQAARGTRRIPNAASALMAGGAPTAFGGVSGAPPGPNDVPNTTSQGYGYYQTAEGWSDPRALLMQVYGGGYDPEILAQTQNPNGTKGLNWLGTKV